MLTSLNLTIQGIVSTVLTLGLLVGALVGLVQCLTTRADAFVAAGKQTKPTWAAILGIAALVVFAFGALQLLSLIAAVGVIVWFVDVRPALRQVLGRASGPYGRW